MRDTNYYEILKSMFPNKKFFIAQVYKPGKGWQNYKEVDREIKEFNLIETLKKMQLQGFTRIAISLKGDDKTLIDYGIKEFLK